MTAEVKLEWLKEIVEKKLKEEQRKQKIQDEIKGIDAIIDKAILENDKKVDLYKHKNRQLKLISQRKGSGGTIRRLDAIMVDMILDKGEFDANQLTLDEMLTKPTAKEDEAERVNAGEKK